MYNDNQFVTKFATSSKLPPMLKPRVNRVTIPGNGSLLCPSKGPEEDSAERESVPGEDEQNVNVSRFNLLFKIVIH